ncbi:hypothetical protein [Microbacterium sp. LMI1-1-1.1]|uniref:hypothetical protein n=1 Tax=Microbacterium sp. LMI1-1-1.1 TaxID=3135223 RepID=UPI0034676A58
MHPAEPPLPSALPLLRARDARSAGLHPESQAGSLRVRNGVYIARDLWDGLAEWDRYVVRVHAFGGSRPGAVFSHESAAALWNLPIFGHPRQIHLFDGRRSRSLRYGDVTVHTSADKRDVARRGELLVTTVADTVLDLARCLPPAFALAVADAAIRFRPADVSLSVLREVVASQRNPRGRRRAEWVIDHADAASESVGESVSRAVIGWCGFPPPLLQQTHIVDGRRYRSDFCWPALRVIGESDGWAKYGADPQEVTRALRAEKRREQDLRRAGWTVARWDFADAVSGEGLRAALLAAGLRPERRADTARLSSIGRNPRSR